MSKDTFAAITHLIMFAGFMLWLMIHGPGITPSIGLFVVAALIGLYVLAWLAILIVVWWRKRLDGPWWKDPLAALIILMLLVMAWQVAYPAERDDAAQAFLGTLMKPTPHAVPIPPAIPPGLAPPPKQKYLILPPVEFDRPYTGKLTVETVATREELKPICGSVFTQFTLACAFRRPDSCRIVIVEESIIKAYRWTRELVMRHEIGHCNGWPGDHPGERPYDAK